MHFYQKQAGNRIVQKNFMDAEYCEEIFPKHILDKLSDELIEKIVQELKKAYIHGKIVGENDIKTDIKSILKLE